jgi:hypothetical protein
VAEEQAGGRAVMFTASTLAVEVDAVNIERVDDVA